MLNKVMFFLPTLGGGGAERTVIQLANNFVQRGVQVDVAVCDLSGAKSKLLAEVDPKIELVNFDCGRVASVLMPLKQRLQAHDYDCIIATQTHSNIVCALAKKLARSQAKLILREVSTPSKNMKLQGLSKFILKTLVNFTYPAADHVVCVSNGVLDDFREYYAYPKANLVTIYNPVIDDAYFEKLKVPVAHRFFQPEHKVVLAVGRLTEAKNFACLIRAFAQCHAKHPETRLIILGEGELRGELEQLVHDLGLSDVVDLPGFDSNPYAYFKYAELFVLSSNWEGLPGVLIQALASKIKVVSTNCPSGPLEILANSKFGLLVECDDVDGLASAMQHAIFQHVINFNAQEFEQHCQQFHKTAVLQRYASLMESSS
ncbi:glycosyl transferase [Acinetobacter sp. ANC 4169]|uniref:glycosyltransferase n=1 Tax=Acinetobacter sp. ANC 4169 TaxID=1977879 RepID=UPI000A3587B4|nr:glycosyltransferase [Acinetobacter sp. ANC 4169]OTG71008.1 glycosyl transferase [Acinetobacter sp. ANC 4169]